MKEHNKPYDDLQKQKDELKKCNPYEDIDWHFNYLDTSIYFIFNEEIYLKYISDEVSIVEDKMGFSFLS